MSSYIIKKQLFSSIATLNKHVTRRNFTKVNSKNTLTKIRIFGAVVGGAVSILGFGSVVYFGAEEKPKKKVVILGSGWGAVSLIKSLKQGQFDISIVSPENYFLFTPLLPGVTVGTVEGRSITESIRKIIKRRHKTGVKFYEAECTQVNVDQNKVVCRDLSSKYNINPNC